MYRVFVGAPSAKDLHHDPQPYRWQTVSSIPAALSQPQAILPPATIEAARRRISSVYQNVSFVEDDDEDDLYAHELSMDEDPSLIGKEQTIVISWPASVTGEPVGDRTVSLDQSRSISFSQEESYSYDEASSIARFPTFNFNLHSLASLSVILKSHVKVSQKVNLVLAVLEVEGPDSVRIKKGPDVGKEVSILKMILGDENGNVGKLTAWREVADIWGGSLINQIGAKRGDVIHLEDVMLGYEPGSPPAFTASSYMKSKMQICYRAMPHTREDSRLRPDLRLGQSDPCVKKVATVVQWFEGMAGLS